MRVLVSGGHGALGKRIAEYCLQNGHVVFAPGREDMDCTNRREVHSVIRKFGPDFLIACAAFTDVRAAETQRTAAHFGNVLTAEETGHACRWAMLPWVYVSTDYVFSGPGPHCVLSEVNPTTEYAKTKRQGELATLRNWGQVARVAFITPEQATNYKWVNAYTLSNREWVEQTAERLVKFGEVMLTGVVVPRIWHLGPPQVFKTRAALVKERFPTSPCLNDLVTTPEEHKRRVGYAAPEDTRFCDCWE
jgi:dTDP-4-dehydrorhamnose reductase